MAALNTGVSSWLELNGSPSVFGDVTDLSVSQRTNLTALEAIAANAGNQSLISIKKLGSTPTSSVNAMRFRCRGKTANTVCAYNLYTGTLQNNTDCALSLLGTLTFTLGAQASLVTPYTLADQLTVTEGGTSASFSGTTSTANDRVAETSIDFQGSDILVIVPITLGSDCFLLGKAY